jgi:hypothetical protein
MNDHLAMIKEQNDHIAKLNAKIAKYELENENFKFACNMLYNGGRPGIKDGISFQSGSQSNIKLNAKKSHSVSHHAYIYSNEASSSRHTTHIKMPKKKIIDASNEHSISFKTFDASFVLTNKSSKVVAKYVGGKHKSPKTCLGTQGACF